VQVEPNAPMPPQSNHTYSFDVFDTCITRIYAHPRDLFYELGLRLAPANLTSKEKHRFAAQFQLQRIRAEKKAHRHAKPRRAVTIEDIYKCFSKPKDLSVDAQELIQAEIDLERDSIYPIPAIVSYIEDLRRAGNRIIFISDMYIPSSLLQPILMEHGVMKEEDTLYVSCDIGATKHHGQLFHYVLKAEGLEASQLLHSGDNLRADIRMAAKANIKANRFYDGMLTLRETDMAGHQLPRHRAKSFQAALARRLRLFAPTGIGPGDNPLDHAISGIIVPLLLSYVTWILDHAKRNGIHRLYFVARDAEIMFRIAQALQGEDDAIQLRYLYGSRRAWLPPSITPGNADWRRLVTPNGESNSRYDIVARMGLNHDSQEALRRILSHSTTEWLSQLPRDQADVFLTELLNNTAAAEVVSSSIAQKREITLSYFKQEGMFDDVPWAFVDAGWSLNTQAAVKRTLASSNIKHHTPCGYYLALARDHLTEDQSGVAYPFVPSAGSIFSRRRVIIEHCFLPSTHATTRGYEVDGKQVLPVFGPELRNEAELSYARRLHETAICGALLIASDPKIKASLREHVDEILSSAARFLRHPREEDARAMATFGTVTDMRHEESFVEPLCRSLGVKDVWTIFSMTLSKKKNFRSAAFMWLEGSMALSPLHVRVPLELLLGIDFLRNWFKR
jgi:FMN phosphatase YigB (HAD superfamily)